MPVFVYLCMAESSGLVVSRAGVMQVSAALVFNFLKKPSLHIVQEVAEAWVLQLAMLVTQVFGEAVVTDLPVPQAVQTPSAPRVVQSAMAVTQTLGEAMLLVLPVPQVVQTPSIP